MPIAVSSIEEDLNSPNHPLYLHQNDHPGLILISNKLTGSENYSSWRISMMIALNAKNKLKIVTGEITEPAANSSVDALWDRTNDMIISWILNTISDQIANEISQLKQDQCTVEIYYQKLKGYWDELDALEAPYICTCICNCENGRVNGEREQRKRLIQFLMGLDECYSNVRGQILLMQPMSNAAKAYGMIRQEEKQKEQHTVKSSISAALSMQSNNRSTSRWISQKTTTATYKKSTFKKGVFCSNCSLEGHTKEECYKIVGYPVGHPLHDKFKPPNRVNSSATQTNTGKSVNMVTSGKSDNTSNEAAMNARMDQLQNQLN
ncbi:uncharacterized protein [Rutidosis leptorrhynchoides]|uniref:uncharacterized protein n=1 Tax=Rutidosis leptorrhynchoides TaxID=125765 RepID=UPI003A999A60